MKRLNIENGTTKQESQSLALYLKEIRKVDSLTHEEEFELLAKIREGDMQALEKLVNANLRFVVSVAKHYQGQGISLPDLICEGNLGLLNAAERYDETRGFKFVTYAVWWIRQAILRALSEHSRIVRLPRNKIESISKISDAFVKLEQEFEREPTTEELAHFLDVELEKIESTISLTVVQVSIDTPINSDEIDSLLDILKDPNAELPDHRFSGDDLLKEEIELLLGELKGKQAQVVKMYYGIDSEENMNMVEISEKLNMTSERVRQIRNKALERLKKSNRYEKLKEYISKE